MRTFDGGATRDNDDGKFDFEGFEHPLVFEAFGRYMHHHRKQADGNLRASDNWQHGIPKDAYIKSLFRHFIDLWFLHRGIERYDRDDGHALTVEEVCCAIRFNVNGYLFEDLKMDSVIEEPAITFATASTFRGCTNCYHRDVSQGAYPCRSCKMTNPTTAVEYKWEARTDA